MMAGQIRLFEKVDGLLVEVAPSLAEDVRQGRRVSSMSLVIDVLWTAEEEAERDAEEIENATREETARVAEEAKQNRRSAALTKLAQKSGMTEQEISELF